MERTLESRFAEVGARLDTLVKQAEDEGRERLADRARQLRYDVAAFRARVDDFDVQAHLAGMDLRDRVQPFLDDVSLRSVNARHVLAELREQATSASLAIQEGVHAATVDLDAAIEAAVDSFR